MPTLITDHRSVFVRLLNRPDGDVDSRERIQQLPDLTVNLPALHELEQLDLPK